MVSNLQFREQIIEAYKKIVPDDYDFAIDRAGQIIWYEKSRQAATEYPLRLSAPKNAVTIQVLSSICFHFNLAFVLSTRISIK